MNQIRLTITSVDGKTMPLPQFVVDEMLKQFERRRAEIVDDWTRPTYKPLDNDAEGLRVIWL